MSGLVHISAPLAKELERLAAGRPMSGEGHVITAGLPGLVDFHEFSPSGARVSTPADGGASLPARGREAAGEAA